MPDATTIWLFQEESDKNKRRLDKLFQRFGHHLRTADYEARDRLIICYSGRAFNRKPFDFPFRESTLQAIYHKTFLA